MGHDRPNNHDFPSESDSIKQSAYPPNNGCLSGWLEGKFHDFIDVRRQQIKENRYLSISSKFRCQKQRLHTRVWKCICWHFGVGEPWLWDWLCVKFFHIPILQKLWFGEIRFLLDFLSPLDIKFSEVVWIQLTFVWIFFRFDDISKLSFADTSFEYRGIWKYYPCKKIRKSNLVFWLPFQFYIRLVGSNF